MSDVAEISFDLVMNDDMSFLEGTYRLPGGDWQVCIFSPDPGVQRPEPASTRWPSGVTGVFVKWPSNYALNRRSALHVLTGFLNVTGWHEVKGPDSMRLR